ncbi:endonuclease domain-containing protein [Pseudoxanthomonas suwonensis]|uniref:endonuclease domain-containing protein n=1 Tax=Pseudoxanthomonas suwonensis TaxID=314722 RepID=UPI002E822C70|nr:DUF559 domain-containing protein [Pseudoxanthomonas suwonensis]
MTNVKPPLSTDTLGHARQMRSESTDVERQLWQHLRAGRLSGLKFRRQHPIPPYIADFCCVERNLVIELDGSQHTPEADVARTRHLQSHGWRALRFWDNEVLTQPEAVLEAIWNAVSETDPLPNPSLPRGLPSVAEGRGPQRPEP